MHFYNYCFKLKYKREWQIFVEQEKLGFSAFRYFIKYFNLNFRKLYVLDSIAREKIVKKFYSDPEEWEDPSCHEKKQ